MHYHRGRSPALAETGQADHEKDQRKQIQKTAGSGWSESHRILEEESAALMKQDRTEWKCEVCGYEMETAQAPEECPICHHQQFALMKRWKCQVCGFVIRDTKPPLQCPLCHKGIEAFTEIPSHPEF